MCYKIKRSMKKVKQSGLIILKKQKVVNKIFKIYLNFTGASSNKSY